MCAAPSTLATRDHVRLLLDVARMYYLEEVGQAEIAERVGYSRPTVSRLLTEAKARGMVRIEVGHPIEQSLELERRLKTEFGLDVAVVAHHDAARTATHPVARLCAETVAQLGDEHAIVALSNGTSVAAVVDAMPQQHWRFSNVVQMVGSLGRIGADLLDSPDLCRRMAGRLGGTYRPMPVPIVMDSPSAARAMRQEELVLTTLELAARSDIAITGIGAVGPHGNPGSILQPFVADANASELLRRGAVAHVCGHYFDAKGRHVRDSMCERVISMDPERLRDVRTSMVAAWGSEKVRALHAVLSAGLINAVATDETTAHLVLAYRPQDES